MPDHNGEFENITSVSLENSETLESFYTVAIRRRS